MSSYLADISSLMKWIFCFFPSVDKKPQEQGKRVCIITPALPETAASVAIAATVVGAAATLLVQRSKSSKTTEVLIMSKYTHFAYSLLESAN